MSRIQQVVDRLQTIPSFNNRVFSKNIPENIADISVPSIYVRNFETKSAQAEQRNLTRQIQEKSFALIIYSTADEQALEALLDEIMRAMLGFQLTNSNYGFVHTQGARTESTPNQIVWADIWTTEVEHRQI